MREWISVKDRLPKPERLVLVYIAANPGPKCFGLGIRESDTNKGWSVCRPFSSWYYTKSEVMYWQPLPEPPKAYKRSNEITQDDVHREVRLYILALGKQMCDMLTDMMRSP